MPNYLKQIVATFAAVMSLVLGMVALMSAVSASTGPWDWSDMSDKLTVRENRPVWAMAYAHPYWYFTDGQELYTGGHVWKSDGSVVSDITVEVRNAGLNRVDDIVSDGQTVIYLKNVVSATRNFEALSYRDGNWGYPAYTWQSKMDSNDSIASISGKDGSWVITTSKGKILNWNQQSNSISQITFNDVKTSNYGSIQYSVRHTSPIDGQTAFNAPVAVPIGDYWFIAYRTTGNMVRLWKVELASGAYLRVSYDITSQFESLQNLQALASNGSRILLAGSRYQSSYTDKVYTYDGTTVKDVTAPAAGTPFSSWNKTLIDYNGKSWMILSNKDLIRFNGSQFEAYGETRDYFVTLAGDENGRMLLGGAVSQLGLSDPTSPLTAKLVRVDEGTGYVAPTTNDHADGEIWIDMWLSNNEHNLYHGDSSRVYVAGSSPNGVNRIEILTYADGKQVHTCTGVEECEITLYGSNYPKGSDIAFNARLVDKAGHEAWTWLGEYHIPLDTETTPTPTPNTNDRLSAWFNFNPSGTTVYDNTTKTIEARASAVDGLQKIEIYVNHAVKRTCTFNRAYGTQNCNYTIYANQYSSSNYQMPVYVKAYDYYGRQLLTSTQYLYRNNTGTDDRVAVWFDGNVSTNDLDRDQSRSITMRGNADDGLNRIELYANNSLVGSCSYSNAYGDQTCTKTIYGSSYSSGQTVSLQAKAIDQDGRYNYSNTVRFEITGTGTNNGNVSAWFYMSPDGQNISNTETRTVQGHASANDGLRNIKVYVNDSVMRTCTFSNAYGTQSCDYSLYGGNNYGSNTLNIKVRAEDRYGRVSWSDTKTYYLNNYNNNNDDVYAWLWFEPSDTTLDHNESKTIKVGASADDGLQKVEIYVNNSLKRTCTYNRAYGNQTCDTTIYGYDYNSGSSISVYAKAYDYYGRQKQTNTSYLTRDGGSQTNNVYAWLWFDPSNTTLNANESKTINVGASSDDGLQKVEIYVNNSLKKTCTYNRAYGNQTCATTIYGNDYSAGSNISVYAQAYDYYGNSKASTVQYLTRSNETQDGKVYAWMWFEPSELTLAKGESKVVKVGSAADDGMKKVEIYVNNSLKKTCTYNRAYGNQVCEVTIYGNDYTTNSSIPVYAKAYDYYGNTENSTTQYLQIEGATQNDVTGTIAITSNKESGYNTNDQITFTANGSDQNGIDRIEILVNAQLVKTCSGIGTCSYTGGPYNTYDHVTYGANLYDTLGNRVWTGYQSISKN